MCVLGVLYMNIILNEFFKVSKNENTRCGKMYEIVLIHFFFKNVMLIHLIKRVC